ncbi:MAG: hypothetical protein WCP28_05780 [Actinomycetes bacterium]
MAVIRFAPSDTVRLDEVPASSSADSGASLGVGWALLRQQRMIVVVVFAVALVARVWASGRSVFHGDEAVEGIAAMDLFQHGRLGWFFPGQDYGGVLETILQAPLQYLAPGNVIMLRLPIQVLNSVTCALFALLILVLLRPRRLALFGGLLAAVFPSLFVLLGANFSAGYAVGPCAAVIGLLLFVRFLDDSRVRTGVAAACAFLLAGYSQPVVLMLILPGLLMIVTLRSPSFFRAEVGAAIQRDFASMMTPRLVLLLLPVAGVVVVQRLVSSADVAAGRALDPSVGSFDLLAGSFNRLMSVRAALGLGTGVENPGDMRLANINQPATWLLFDINRLGTGFAIAAAAVVWLVVLLVAVGYVGTLFVGEPSERGARLGSAALGLALLGVLLAAYAVVMPSMGRYVYPACLVGVFALVLVVSTVPRRVELPMMAVTLVLATVLTVVDFGRLPMQTQSFDADPRVLAATAGKPLVGEYADAYDQQFLSQNKLLGIPLQANRFPESLASLAAGGRTEVVLMMPAATNPVRQVADRAMKECRVGPVSVVGSRVLYPLDCPNWFLRLSSSPAFRLAQ